MANYAIPEPYSTAYDGIATSPDGLFDHFIRRVKDSHITSGYWSFHSNADGSVAYRLGYHNPEAILIAEDRGDGPDEEIKLRWMPGITDTYQNPRRGTAKEHLEVIAEERAILRLPASFRDEIPIYTVDSMGRLDSFRRDRHRNQTEFLSSNPAAQAQRQVLVASDCSSMHENKQDETLAPSYLIDQVQTGRPATSQGSSAKVLRSESLHSTAAPTLGSRSNAETYNPLVPPTLFYGDGGFQSTTPASLSEPPLSLPSGLRRAEVTRSHNTYQPPYAIHSARYVPQSIVDAWSSHETTPASLPEVPSDLSAVADVEQLPDPDAETASNATDATLDFYLDPGHAPPTQVQNDPTPSIVSDILKKQGHGPQMATSPPISPDPSSLTGHDQDPGTVVNDAPLIESDSRPLNEIVQDLGTSNGDTSLFHAGVDSPIELADEDETFAFGDEFPSAKDAVTMPTHDDDLPLSSVANYEAELHTYDDDIDFTEPLHELHINLKNAFNVQPFPCIDCGKLEGHDFDCNIIGLQTEIRLKKKLNAFQEREIADAVKLLDPEQWRKHQNPPPPPPLEEHTTVIKDYAVFIRNEESYREDPDLHTLEDDALVILWGLKSLPNTKCEIIWRHDGTPIIYDPGETQLDIEDDGGSDK